ncbi:MAG: DNA-deoxyinosine glycosylase [Acutalibacteraceae bacterium]
MFYHTFDPVYDENSRVLILGSFPSVKSREQGFYYAHAQNRFWRVIADITGEETPQTVEEKKSLLLRRNIALWDVAHCCEVDGSSDSSMRNVRPNDIAALLENTQITRIFANGKTAAKLYEKLVAPETGVPITCLPSTSPANAAFSLERLREEWEAVVTDTYKQ